MKQTMHLNVISKQFNLRDSLKTQVTKEIEKLTHKHADVLMDANVVFIKEKNHFECEVVLHARRGILLQSKVDADDPMVAFEAALNRVAKRLGRYKKRLLDMHQKGMDSETKSELMASQYILEAETEAESEAEVETPNGDPIIIAEMETRIETMSVSEAVMRLSLAELSALMFRSGVNGEMNMVYHRKDGNIGWVDPKSE
ncbi:MAG: ribosome-associated translation inhibitor RaiA [Pseudomonadota bacterium]|nr:ribosome-associated translation inhibitor RaiA [Pseudomonadota bacterium]